VSAVYVLRPKADQDLDDQAFYLATQAGPGFGHRFLLAAHETFAMLAAQPQIGWRPHLKRPGLASLRVFHVSGFEKCSCSIFLSLTELRFYE
jgi:plasmid stabilization system protein ParE